jgi:hypothetical protein
VARLDPQARRQDGDWDQLVNALQYRDAPEYGVGHNVGVEVDLDANGGCSRLRTTWIPQATVEKVGSLPGRTWAASWAWRSSIASPTRATQPCVRP